jgi:hypothetical protein
VIIEADTLVPELVMHSFSLVIPRPRIIEPAVNKSGLTLPTPSKSDHVVIPLEENDATLVRLLSREPTPMTLMRSPGLFRVP